jgi:hypothetical protein
MHSDVLSEGLNEHVKITLIRIFYKWDYEYLDWFQLAHDRGEWQGLVNVITIIQIV